jgi:hypothetical protein
MMDRNRKEAEKFSDLAKAASSPFVRAYYWNTALRYLSSEGELSLAQNESRIHILSENAPLASSSVEVSVEGIGPRNDEASLAAMNRDRSLEAENTERSDDRHTLEALKRLYRELHPSCTPSENS